MELTSERIKRRALELGAQVVGIGALYDAEDPQRDPRSILPWARSIIGFGFAVPRGLYRAMEHGNQYYTYTTLGVKDRKSTRLNSSHTDSSRMPSSA